MLCVTVAPSNGCLKSPNHFFLYLFFYNYLKNEIRFDRVLYIMHLSNLPNRNSRGNGGTSEAHLFIYICSNITWRVLSDLVTSDLVYTLYTFALLTTVFKYDSFVSSVVTGIFYK